MKHLNHPNVVEAFKMLLEELDTALKTTRQQPTCPPNPRHRQVHKTPYSDPRLNGSELFAVHRLQTTPTRQPHTNTMQSPLAFQKENNATCS